MGTRSYVETRTGLSGMKLLRVLRQGIAFPLDENTPLPGAELVNVLGVLHRVVYFGSRRTGEPPLAEPVELEMLGVGELARGYLESNGGVPSRIAALAKVEDALAPLPVAQHLFAAAALRYLSWGR